MNTHPQIPRSRQTKTENQPIAYGTNIVDFDFKLSPKLIEVNGNIVTLLNADCEMVLHELKLGLII